MQNRKSQKAPLGRMEPTKETHKLT